MSTVSAVMRREACMRLLDLFGFDDDKLTALEMLSLDDDGVSKDVFIQTLLGVGDVKTVTLTTEQQIQFRRLDRLFDVLDSTDTTGIGDKKLQAQELRSFFQPNPHFTEEYKTAGTGFGFTIAERTAFLDAFIAAQAHNPTKSFVMDIKEFQRCWRKARGFDPSEQTLLRVRDRYSLGGVLEIDALDFAQRCMGNPSNLGSQPFPVAYFQTQLQKHKDLAGLLYFVPFLVLFTVYLLSGKGLGVGYFLHVQNEKMMVDQQFTMPCAPPCTAPVELSYADIGDPPQFYQWLREVVVPALWGEAGASIAEGPLQHHVFPVGALRIESLRVKGANKTYQREYYFGGDNSSESAASIGRLFTDAEQGGLGLTYPMQTDCSAPSGEPFGPGLINSSSGPLADAFRFKPCVDLATDCVTGAIGRYPCGGFNAIIPFNLTKATVLEYIDDLERGGWLDIQSRSVFLHHVLFSKDTQLVYKSLLGFEISNGGKWVPLRRTLAFKYFSWKDKSVAWILFFVVYIVYILLYIGKTGMVICRKIVRSMGHMGGNITPKDPIGLVFMFKRGFADAFSMNRWLLMDTVTFIFFISVWVYRAIVWARKPEDKFYEIHSYSYHLDDYANDIQTIDYLDSVIAFLLYLRLFKYFKLFRVLDCITRTIYVASYELYGVAFTFFVIIVAFSLCGFVLYSDVLTDFSTVPKSMETLLRFIVGDFDYASWAAARRVVSPIFFALIFIILVLILFNSVVAVLADNFEDVVKSEFDSSNFLALVERDPTCAITFDRGISWKRIANSIILHELLRFPRWVLRKLKKPAYLGGDPRHFWETMVLTMRNVYYETNGDAIDTFLDIAESVDDTDALLAKETMEAIHRVGKRPIAEEKRLLGIDHKVLTLWEVLKNTFGTNAELFVMLGVHRPNYVLSIPRGDLLLELVDVHFLWRQQQMGDNANDNPADEAPALTDAFRETYKKCKLLQGADSRRQSRAATETVFHNLRQTASFSEMVSDPWMDSLVLRAYFSGLPREVREIDKFEDFKEAWTKAHKAWRYEGQVPGNYEIETLVNILTEDEFERLKATRDVAVYHDTMLVDRVGFRASQRRRFAAERDAYLEERRKALPAHQEVDADYIPLADFKTLWAKALGTEMNAKVEDNFTILSEVMLGASQTEPLVKTTKFEELCTSNHFVHSSKSFPGQYFAIQRKKVFDITNLVLYLPFLAFFTYLLVSHYGIGQVTRMSEAVIDNIAGEPFEGSKGRMTFSDIHDTPDYYAFLRSNVAGKLFRADGGGPAAFDGMNVMVGAIRVRQLRAGAESGCGYAARNVDSLSTFYRERARVHFNGECTPSWSRADRSKRDFGANVGNLSPLAAAAFRYSKCDSPTNLFGDNAIYTCGGHSLILPLNLTAGQAASIIDELEQASWINGQTRALVLEGFAFNYNNDMFLRAQFLVETTGGGLFVPSNRGDAFQLFKLNTREWHYYLLLAIFVGLLVVNIAYYIVYIVRSILHLKESMSTTVRNAFVLFTAKDSWWLLETVNYCIFIASWIMRFSTMVQDADIIRIYESTSFPNVLVRHAEFGYAILILDAANVLLCYIKIFRFVTLQPQLNVLSNALGMAAKSLFAIVMITFVLLSGFALAGHIVFGHTVFSMSDMGLAYESLIVASIPGEGEDALRAWYADRPLFTGFYFTLIVIVLLILMSQMVTSVVAQAYGESKNMQFDPRPVRSTIVYDPSVDGGDWLRTVIRNPATQELAYWLGRAFYGITERRDPVNRTMRLKLRNPRIFYSTMASLVVQLETGSPREAAIAAAELVYIARNATIDENGSDVDVRRQIERELLRKPPCKLYGVPRYLVRQYCYKSLPKELANTIEFWCMELPVRALSIDRDEAVINTLQMLLPWKKEAKTYCELDDAKDEATENFEPIRRQIEKIGTRAAAASSGGDAADV